MSSKFEPVIWLCDIGIHGGVDDCTVFTMVLCAEGTSRAPLLVGKNNRFACACAFFTFVHFFADVSKTMT